MCINVSFYMHICKMIHVSAFVSLHVVVSVGVSKRVSEHVCARVCVCVHVPGAGSLAAHWVRDSGQAGGSLSASRRSHTDLLHANTCYRPQTPESRHTCFNWYIFKIYMALIQGDSKIRHSACWGGKRDTYSYDMITDITVKLLQFSSNFEISLLHIVILLAV